MHIVQAATIGLGTYTTSAAALAGTTTLADLCGLAALPDGCSDAEIQVTAGTVYRNNDGTDADANDMPMSAGDVFQVNNSSWLLSQQLRFFADAQCTIVVALNKSHA
ncbi:MAG: hypothetical protein WBX15_17795 [Thermoanaerobaculia bacterium]